MRVTGRAIALVALLLATQLCAVEAAREQPPYWLAISVDGAELNAGPDATPATGEVALTVAPGQTVNLRAKVVGGRRAYMMWPDTYANVGPNTTILVHGFNEMEYQVQTEAFRGTGKWTVTEEKYTWSAGGQGAVSPVDPGGERVNWTAPTQPGTYQITVSGGVKFHFRREAPGGVFEDDEDSGTLSRTVRVVVRGDAPAQAMTQQQALQLIMSRFNNLGTGPTEGSYPTYVASAGFWNNVYSVFSDANTPYVCGGWQGTVLDMLDSMRNGTDTEKQVFQRYDYGPIHAYYGGHQAVVIYPKGTDWQQTGIVLDPWPNQQPETFTIANWKSRFWFGVAPSSVYKDQYPLTGASAYPAPRLKISQEHMAVLRRLPEQQRNQYLALTNVNDRNAFISNLPPGTTDTTAVAVHSPVQMLITDAQGRRVGWVDQSTWAYEIPGVDVDCFPESGGQHGMVVLLPQGNYDVQITGTGSGTFGFTQAVPPTVSANPLTHRLDVPIQPGQRLTCRLSPIAADAALIGPGGAAIPLEPIPTQAGTAAPGNTAVTATPATPTAEAGTTVGGGAAVAPPAPIDMTGVTITSPRDGDRIRGRVEVTGTGRPGALIVVSTEARAQEDDELLRDVPGSRHRIEDDGTWRVWVAAPTLPDNIAVPLYYTIKAKWITQQEESDEVQVKVFRAE